MLGSVIAAAAVAVAVVMLADLGRRRSSCATCRSSTRCGGSRSSSSRVVAALVGAGDGGRRILLAVLVGLWGLRLGAHLTLRKLGESARRTGATRRCAERRGAALPALEPGDDLRAPGPARARRLAAGAGGRAMQRRRSTRWIVPGVVLWAVGLGFETVGDEQLRRFKADPAQPGPGDGPRPVALHPPPQLLRRRLRVVGDLARGAARPAARGGRSSGRW